jgi:hypothetical protein
MMPAEPGGGTGERIKFWRAGHDSGHLNVWRKDLIDPKYSPLAAGVKPSDDTKVIGLVRAALCGAGLKFDVATEAAPIVVELVRNAGVQEDQRG